MCRHSRGLNVSKIIYLQYQLIYLFVCRDARRALAFFMSKLHTYSCEDIVVLEAWEAIRLRPGMFLGDLAAPHSRSRLLAQPLTFAAEASLSGRPASARVRLFRDGSVIIDDDIGIPLAEKWEKWTPELLFTQLHGGGGKAEHLHLSPLFFGAPLISALSKTFELEIIDGGRRYRQTWHKGQPSAPDLRDAPDRRSAASYRFTLDPEIFPETGFDADSVKAALEDVKLMCPSLRLGFEFDGHRADLRQLAPLTGAPRVFLDRIIAAELETFGDRVDPALPPIGELARLVATTGPWRPAQLQVRVWLDRGIDQLLRGRVQSSVEDYLALQRRLEKKRGASVRLLELLADAEKSEARIERKKSRSRTS